MMAEAMITFTTLHRGKEEGGHGLAPGSGLGLGPGMAPAQAQAWAQAQAQGSQTKAFKWYGVGTCGFFLLSQRKKPMGFCNFPALGLGKTS